MIACLRFLLPFLIALPAYAQLSATIQLPKRDFVAGEALPMVVTITNHSGRDLTLQSDGRLQWLDILINDRNGRGVAARRGKMFGPMKIKASQTMAREVDLNQYFYMQNPGNYSVAAVIRLPGSEVEGGSTNRLTFNLTPGTKIWSQRVGVMGGAMIREFRLLTFSGEKTNQLYAQVLDGKSEQKLSTFRLGDVLMLRRPSATVDRQQRLHVLFLCTPSVYVHCEIDSDGRLVNRSLHRRPPQGEPMLVTAGNGSVGVANSIPYDPKQEGKARAKTRKASDRPAGAY